MAEQKSWNLKMTEFAARTENPLRKIWEGPKIKPNSEKKEIKFQIGDPTIFKNFKASPESIDAIKNALDNDPFSYTVSAGLEQARASVAEYVNALNADDNNNNPYQVDSHDIILTNGCSQSIEIASRSLASIGDNILIPRPTWNYTTWMHGSGIEVQYYNLNPEKKFFIDLEHLESLINERTKAILVNNVGNPCGNVFSKKHILKLIAIAERHQLPIISDDVYEKFVYPGCKYHSVSSLSKNVPVLSCSGLTKRFMMPGIRMGWIVIHDRNGQFDEIRKGLQNIAGRNFWPNSTVQLALPDILKNTPSEYFDDNSRHVHQHALSAYEILKDAPGIIPIMPSGSFYMMIKIELERFPKFESSMDVFRVLIEDENVHVFPGEIFNFNGFIRIVLTVPFDALIDGCNRIKEFCEKNCKLSESEKFLKKG